MHGAGFGMVWVLALAVMPQTLQVEEVIKVGVLAALDFSADSAEFQFSAFIRIMIPKQENTKFAVHAAIHGGSIPPYPRDMQKP